MSINQESKGDQSAKFLLLSVGAIVVVFVLAYGVGTGLIF